MPKSGEFLVCGWAKHQKKPKKLPIFLDFAALWGNLSRKVGWLAAAKGLGGPPLTVALAVALAVGCNLKWQRAAPLAALQL